MFFWLAKMIWMMAPIGRGGKGRAFPPVSISQWGQRADQRCFLSPTLTPVLPPPCGPGTWRTAPSGTRRTRSRAHRMASPRQSHSGPRAPARGRAGPPTHTPGEGTRPLRAVYAQTHTQTHRLTLNGHIKPNSVFFSHTHTHTHLHTHSWFHTHIGDDVLTPSEGCAPSKEEAYFLSTVVLEVEGVVHDRHISTSPVNHDSK